MTSGALDRMTEGGSPSSTRRSRPAQTYGLLVAPMPRPTTPCDTPCWTSADERALCTFRVEGQERTVRTGSGQRDLH